MKISVYISFIMASILMLSTNASQAQTQIKNNVLLTPYFGFPNVKWITYQANQEENWETTGGLHYGLAGEYVLSNRVGIGFDALYSPITRTRTNPYTVFDGNTNTLSTHDDIYKFYENKLRVFVTANIHFLQKSDRWDLYVEGGIGLNYVFTDATLNGEDVSYDLYMNEKDFITNLNYPVAARVSFGARVYITKFLAVNAQVGIGGPPIAFGLSFNIGRKSWGRSIDAVDF